MASKMQPTSKKLAPDASDCYERAHPDHEGGLGEEDTTAGGTPVNAPDKIHKAVTNRQDGTRQLNGEDMPRTHGGAQAKKLQ